MPHRADRHQGPKANRLVQLLFVLTRLLCVKISANWDRWLAHHEQGPGNRERGPRYIPRFERRSNGRFSKKQSVTLVEDRSDRETAEQSTRFAFAIQVGKNWRMQGSSRSDRNLLDGEEFCRHSVKPDPVHAVLANHRIQLFRNELPESLFSSGGGRPSVHADVIAIVMVLQDLEGLSDREAFRTLQRDISWKVVCELDLTDEAFHPTVIVLWRTKIRASTRLERVFEAVRVMVDQSGVAANLWDALKVS